MADDGRKGTFGRGLQKFIANNLPYRSPAAIIDDVAAENPKFKEFYKACLLYTSPSPRDVEESRMPSSA